MLTINNLSARLRSRREILVDAMARVLDSGWVVLGPEVRGFESAFARYLGLPFCVGVANGTDAIELGLRALGVHQGDRVITTANAGMYSTVAIRSIGAEPLYVDVDEETSHVTLADISAAVDTGARACVLTHLYGRAVRDTAEIVALCNERNIVVLEDCAQAHGALLHGRRVGSFGKAAAFSFYPTKNLGALGDGGAIATSDESVAEQAQRLRQYGWTEKYRCQLPGGRNSRLDELQAAILSALLPQLDADNDRRREIAAKYARDIRHRKVQLPPLGGADDVCHLYVIRSERRDSLREWLRQQSIGTEVHYPTPDHLQPVSAGLPERRPVLRTTERLAQEILTLPCYPELPEEDVENVIRAINEWPER